MRRFGEPDTSLKVFWRMLWYGVRHDLTTKIFAMMAFIMPGYLLWHNRMDMVLLIFVIYVVSLTVHYLIWRHLVKKGAWWLV